MLGLQSNYLFAQCLPPPPQTFITLGGNISGNYFNEIIYINTNATVPNGVLVQFTDCDVYVAQGVSVTINNGGRIEIYSNVGDHVWTACDNNPNTNKEWWNGFVVEPGGGLHMYKNPNTTSSYTVSNALTCIQASNPNNLNLFTKITLYNIQFVNNRTTLRYHDFREGDLDQKFVTQGCIFTADENYPGTDTEGGAHPAMEPTASGNNIPDYGCDFENLGTLSDTPSLFYFGYPGATPNQFINLQTGIWIKRSSYVITNNRFARMINVNPLSSTYSNSIGGIGICCNANNGINNGSTPFRLRCFINDNSFEDISRAGIIMESFGYNWTPAIGPDDMSAEIIIGNNSFINSANPYTSNGITETFGDAPNRAIMFTYDIEISGICGSNFIQNFRDGIRVVGSINSGRYAIRSNTIRNVSLSNPSLLRFPNNSTGIWIQASSTYRIDHGGLFLNTVQGFTTGIFLNNISMQDMFENNVIYGATTDAIGNCATAYGYRIENCVMDSSLYIRHWDLFNATITCGNTTNGICTPTTIGVAIGSVANGVNNVWCHDLTITGGQESMRLRGSCNSLNITCNQFNNYSNRGVYFLNFNNPSTTPTDITKTPYLPFAQDEPSDNTWNMPTNRVNGSNLGSTITWWWRNNGNQNYNPSSVCVGFEFNPNSTPLTDEICPGPQSGYREEEIELSLLRKFIIGDAQHLLSREYKLNDYAQTIKTVNNLRLIHLLENKDWVNSGASDDALYSMLHNNLKESNAYTFYLIQQAINSADFNRVKLLAESVSPENTCEALMKQTYLYLAKYQVSKPEDFDKEDFNKIREIAHLNLYQYGPAVSLCRALLHITVDDDELRTEEIYANDTNQKIYMSVAPNPASNAAVVIFSKELKNNLQINLLDVTGRLVTTQTAAAGSMLLKLDLENLNKGIYFIQGEGVSTIKLIKQ